jgi:hypothetical protein
MSRLTPSMTQPESAAAGTSRLMELEIAFLDMRYWCYRSDIITIFSKARDFVSYLSSGFTGVVANPRQPLRCPTPCGG